MSSSSPNEDERRQLMAAFKKFKTERKKYSSNPLFAVDNFERQVNQIYKEKDKKRNLLPTNESLYNNSPKTKEKAKTKAKNEKSSSRSSDRLPPPRKGRHKPRDRVLKKVKKKIKRVSKKKKK